MSKAKRPEHDTKGVDAASLFLATHYNDKDGCTILAVDEEMLQEVADILKAFKPDRGAAYKIWVGIDIEESESRDTMVKQEPIQESRQQKKTKKKGGGTNKEIKIEEPDIATETVYYCVVRSTNMLILYLQVNHKRNFSQVEESLEAPFDAEADLPDVLNELQALQESYDEYPYATRSHGLH